MSLVNKNHKSDGGEIDGMREARDRMEKRLRETGSSEEHARRVATECAQRADRRQSN